MTEQKLKEKEKESKVTVLDASKEHPWVLVVFKPNSTEVQINKWEKINMPYIHRSKLAILRKRDELRRQELKAHHLRMMKKTKEEN